jgi:hypothetical protein
MPATISLHTVATFCETTAEMLEGASDKAELIKRHRESLVRCRQQLVKSLLDPTLDPNTQILGETRCD